MQNEEVYKIRKITKEDYSIIGRWCKAWGFPDLTQQEALLPKNSFIVSCNEIDVCCGFLYFTDSLFAHPEWIISNKEYKDKTTRKIAFKKLFEAMEDEAKKNGFGLFLMSVKDKSLMRFLKEIDFIETDTNMTNFLKKI
jgi:hypothetical protein